MTEACTAAFPCRASVLDRCVANASCEAAPVAPGAYGVLCDVKTGAVAARRHVYDSDREIAMADATIYAYARACPHM